eukprot:6048171-Amphidinium_carterae.2
MLDGVSPSEHLVMHAQLWTEELTDMEPSWQLPAIPGTPRGLATAAEEGLQPAPMREEDEDPTGEQNEKVLSEVENFK